MAVNDVYKATAKFDAPDADGEMNFNIHYRTVTVNTPQGDTEEAQAIADTLVNQIALNYVLLMPTPITFLGVDVIGVTNPLIGVTSPASNPGGGGANPVSYRSAPVAKLLTGIRGRSYNGRIYLMTVDESQQTGGVMLPSYTASLQTAVESFRLLTDIATTNEFQATIFSKTLTGTGPIVDNIVSTIQINPRFGTQRSRQDVA